MTLQPGKQIIPMHILLKVSRSKDNQIMKFGGKPQTLLIKIEHIS